MENSFGKPSVLSLSTVCKNGLTELDSVYFTAPFKIMKPFRQADGGIRVMLQTASAGIMGGDEQQLSVRIGSGSRVEFVSQAYEKIHRMNGGSAQRQTQIWVDSGATFLYRPLPVIPFADSAFKSDMTVRLADGTSRFVLADILSCGRAALGERFSYRLLQNNVRVFRGARLIYRDHTRFEPSVLPMEELGFFEGFTHQANILVCGNSTQDGFLTDIRELIDAMPDIEGGVSRTAFGDMSVRMLGRSGQQLSDCCDRILDLLNIRA